MACAWQQTNKRNIKDSKFHDNKNQFSLLPKKPNCHRNADTTVAAHVELQNSVISFLTRLTFFLDT